MKKERAKRMLAELFDKCEWEDVQLAVTFDNAYIEFSVYPQKEGAQ